MADPNDPAALTLAMNQATAATRAFGAETQSTLSGVTDNYRRASSGGRDFSTSLVRAFDNVALKGKSLSDTLSSLALDLSRLVLNSAVRSLGNSIGGSGGISLSGMFGSLFANADGNVIAGGRIKPFAKGGVISSPMLFPLQNGTGLAGEAGAEAILPLQRGADGRLGVAGGSGQAATHIHFNVTANDADSFRRSEAQIAAMLNRISSRGARNL